VAAARAVLAGAYGEFAVTRWVWSALAESGAGDKVTRAVPQVKGEALALALALALTLRLLSAYSPLTLRLLSAQPWPS
jgi:hypothetical protein